jgi:hypothetical protein
MAQETRVQRFRLNRALPRPSSGGGAAAGAALARLGIYFMFKPPLSGRVVPGI